MQKMKVSTRFLRSGGLPLRDRAAMTAGKARGTARNRATLRAARKWWKDAFDVPAMAAAAAL
jgi:hypothetical protein